VVVVVGGGGGVGGAWMGGGGWVVCVCGGGGSPMQRWRHLLLLSVPSAAAVDPKLCERAALAVPDIVRACTNLDTERGCTFIGGGSGTWVERCKRIGPGWSCESSSDYIVPHCTIASTNHTCETAGYFMGTCRPPASLLAPPPPALASAGGAAGPGTASVSLSSPAAGSVAPVWQFKAGDSIESTPAVVDGRLFVGSGDSRLYALNATDGSKLWSYKAGGSIWGSSPGIENGRVFFGCEDHKLYSLDVSKPSADNAKLVSPLAEQTSFLLLNIARGEAGGQWREDLGVR